MSLQQAGFWRRGDVLFSAAVILGTLLLLVVLIRKFRIYGWYAALVLGPFVAALLSRYQIFFYAFVLGLLTAVAEIITKFRDEPTKTLRKPEALFYILLNGLISAAALQILLLYDVSITTPLDRLKVVLIAGLGSMLVLRSRLFNIKVGAEDISLGPDQIVKVFFRFMEESLDRGRSRARIEFIKVTMENIDFDKVFDYSLTMLDAAQTLSPSNVTELKDKLETIQKNKTMEVQVKSYKLGFLLLNQMGEEFVKKIFANPPSSWLITAPTPSTKPQGLLDRFVESKDESSQFFAYGSTMSVRRIRERLPWSESEVARFLKLAEPTKCTLNGFRIVFNKPAREDSGRQGFANIAPDQHGKVEGVLYRISETAMAFLYGFEPGYRRIQIEVEVNNVKKTAQAYISENTSDGLKPKKDYLAYILEGAREYALSAEYIRGLEQVETLS